VARSFRDLFPSGKPIIAMAHVPPLPGTPLYDERRGVDGLVDSVRTDLRVLLEWVEREEAQGEGEAPYPPNFPKMPGEPKRVQPSRAKKKSDKA